MPKALSMRRTLRAEIKVRLIQALVKSLGKRDFDLVNAQVFLLKFGGAHLYRGDELVDTRIWAAVHFGHPSRAMTEEPLVKVTLTRDQWLLVLANVEECNRLVGREESDA